MSMSIPGYVEAVPVEKADGQSFALRKYKVQRRNLENWRNERVGLMERAYQAGLYIDNVAGWWPELAPLDGDERAKVKEVLLGQTAEEKAQIKRALAAQRGSKANG